MAGIKPGPGVVERVLAAAADSGIRVMLGLYLGGFNNSVAQLDLLAARNQETATELVALYGAKCVLPWHNLLPGMSCFLLCHRAAKAQHCPERVHWRGRECRLFYVMYVTCSCDFM